MGCIYRVCIGFASVDMDLGRGRYTWYIREISSGNLRKLRCLFNDRSLMVFRCIAVRLE